MTSPHDSDAGHLGEDILRLLYCSRVPRSRSPDQIEDDIELILRTSRRENLHLGITGVLVTDKKMYSQVIEGPPRVIKDLIGRISCDTRHRDVRIVSFHNSRKRIFTEWSMAFLATTRDLEAEDYIFPISDDSSNILAISTFCSSVRSRLLDQAKMRPLN